ncbi:MAG: IPT/TIG domain-containing protein [Cyclobacteriaceae bacterium]
MRSILVGIVFILTLFTCTQEEITSRAYPRVRTSEVVNIGNTGSVFRGEITFASSEIIDHGFIWSANQSLDLNKVEKIRLGPKSGPGVFESEVGFGLAQGVKYYFKAFVQSDTHIVYGEILEFVSLGSLAPIIDDFNPKEASWNDTLTLIGRNFSGVVKFGDTEAEIMEHNDKVIKVKVPLGYVQPEGFISILFSGNTSSSKDKFKIKTPVINEFTPNHGKFGDQVTIIGNYFHPLQLAVSFNEISAEILTRTATQILCKIPSGLSSGMVNLKVSSGQQSVTASETFYYEAPVISEIIPSEGTYGDLITIKGNHFGSLAGESIVKFEGEVAEIITVTSSEIKVKVPETVGVPAPKITISYNQQISNEREFSLLPPIITSFTPESVTTNTEVVITGSRFSPVLENNNVNFGGVSGEIVSVSSTEIRVLVPDSIASHELELEVLSSGVSATTNAKIKSPWKLISIFPYSDGNQPLVRKHYIVANNKLFVIATSNPNAAAANFYEFIPTSNSFQRKSDFPAYGTSWHWSCFVNDKLYVGYFPFREVYEYSLVSDTWRLHSEIIFGTGNFKFGLSSFNDGFMFNYDMEYWKYDLSIDSWIKKDNLPELYPNNGFAFNEQLFVFGNASLDNSFQMWEYNVTADTWSFINGDLPSESGVVFGLDNRGFFSTMNGDLYEYKPSINSWEQGLNFPFILYEAPLISIHQSSKAYFFNNNDVWEFDPNY